MRNLGFAALLALGACNTVPADETQPPVRGETPGRTCQEEGLSRFVGQPASESLGAQILRESGAATLRWIPEGSAITMDYRSDRVNARLDRQNRVVSVTCG